MKWSVIKNTFLEGLIMNDTESSSIMWKQSCMYNWNQNVNYLQIDLKCLLLRFEMGSRCRVHTAGGIMQEGGNAQSQPLRFSSTSEQNISRTCRVWVAGALCAWHVNASAWSVGTSIPTLQQLWSQVTTAVAGEVTVIAFTECQILLTTCVSN